jgi:aminomethyltransferase
MKKSPFYFLSEKAGATAGAGAWASPQKYTTPEDEHNAVRNSVGITDFSSMGKFEIQGPDAKKFIQKLIVNDVGKLVPGKALYSCMTNENGGMFDDTTVYCASDEYYILIGSTAGREKDVSWFETHKSGLKVYISDITGAYGLLSVQGPKSREMLNLVCTPGLDDLKYFRFKKATIANCPVLVSRTGFTGELGYEVYIQSEDGPDVWDALAAVGTKFNMRYVGMLAASGTLRLEKGYLGGKDYGTHTNPYEVGLGWTVALNTDFIGCAALKKIKEKGIEKFLIGFKTTDKTKVPATKDPLFSGEKEIGVVTSAAYSFTLGESIGLAWVEATSAKIGEKVKIKSSGAIIDATLADKVFYDPKGEKLRS